MSKLFSDPVYEDMCESEDAWLELAVEPYVFRANDTLRAFPSEYEFSYEDFVNMTQHHHTAHMRLDYSTLLPYVFDKCVESAELDSFTRSLFYKYTMLRIEDGAQFDRNNHKLTGSVKLVKTQECVHEQDIPAEISLLVGKKFIGIGKIRSHAATIRRLSEIQDILGAEYHRNSRSANNKLNAIRGRLSTIIRQDLWKIRDADLAAEMVDWVIQYGLGGKIHALTNLSRLKCMTHGGAPIYSMEKYV